ncbi:MAG TPA: holo-ACP synthase [Gemmatimonadales bacterium]|nr:holo-ACP synthase [Gemmatimonadales bacterium]
MVVGPDMSVIGVGVDLVSLDRARRMLERRGEYALTRLLRPSEAEYLRERADPAPHFAARLAAKEAVYKAMQSLPGARAIGWQDIEVLRDNEGRPTILLHGVAAEVASTRTHVVVHLSLSHTHEQAVATAVLEAD